MYRRPARVQRTDLQPAENYSLKIACVFAALGVLVIMGISLHMAVNLLQRRVVFWRRPPSVEDRP